MKHIASTFATALPVLACTATMSTPAAAQIILAQNQKTDYVITLAADAIPAEKTAAQELQKYLQQVTGAAFPIGNEKEARGGAHIYIGAGPRVKALLPQQNWGALGADGIVIKSVGKDLILAGGRPRGTLYATYQFLENEAGCRWWTPTESRIPSRATLSIAPQNVAYVPPFRYREHYTTAVQADPVFATKMRQNGHHQGQKEDWGGHYRMLGFVHTFSLPELLPVEKYFKDHPEWFSDPDNGSRPGTKTSRMPAPQSTDPCYSSPGVLEEVTRNALQWISQNRDAGYISISQNDSTDGYCRDGAALELIKQEGSPSAPLLKFVNAVAAKIHEQYPDFQVETLAYNYSEMPPKTIRPAKNVVMRLAPISSDFGHPFDSDWNKVTREKVKAWSKISPQLFIWNYVTNFYGNVLPHPNWDGLAPDLRFFAENKVTGIFEQGDNYTNGVGDFVQLRAWLMAKLMWNPYQDQNKLIDEFMEGYYGAAAPLLRRYIDGVQAAFLAQKRSLPTYNQDLSFFDLETTNRSLQLFDAAEAAVKDDATLLARVKRERLSLELARLYRFAALQEESGKSGKTLLGNPDPREGMEQFISRAKGFGLQNLREASPGLEIDLGRLRSMFDPVIPLPAPFDKLAKEDVIDMQPGGYNLYEQGKVSFLETDEASLSKRAASIIGDSMDWAIQVPVGLYLNTNQPQQWHVYAMARVTLKPGAAAEGIGFRSGQYDNDGRSTITYDDAMAADVSGPGYHLVDLGVRTFKPSVALWFAPTRNPAIEKVYLERVILVRPKAAQ